MVVRESFFAGSFYPNNDSIYNFFTQYNNKLEAKAIIVPHAGYIYSGFVANEVYKQIKLNKDIILIGPSHRYNFKGISVGKFDLIKTPIGNLEVSHLVDDILKLDFANFYPQAHQEHSTETQFPFIKYYFDKKVAEVVYSNIDYKELSYIFNLDAFFIISTDLSHFYTLEEAKKIDKKCIDGIIAKNDLKGCEACGIVGVKALIHYFKDSEFKLVCYKTSYDTTKDSLKVVGYSSFIIN